MKKINFIPIIFFLLAALFSCEEEDKAPIGTNKITVGTTTGSTVLYTTATVSSSIKIEKGNEVIEHGHCWGTAPNPVVEGCKTTLGSLSEVKTFTSQLDQLSANTSYYIRPYITTEYETIYGKETTIKTLDYSKPIVTTTAITGTTPYLAASGGTVTSDGGLPVTARGICWSTSSNPTISNNKTNDGSNTGSFSSSITGLNPGTTYYVCAYAVNSVGTAYGNILSFTTTKIINNSTINGYTLTQDEIWSGTISLKGDIVVPKGISLTINPGTIVLVSTGTPIYDEGGFSNQIDFYIKGSLIMNSTAQNIIQLKSDASSPTNKDWFGIWVPGGRLEISYCYFSDGEQGVTGFGGATMTIKNCCFNNMTWAISDQGCEKSSLTFNSFVNCHCGYFLWESNLNVQLDYSEFRSNAIDVNIQGTSTDKTDHSSVSVNYCNFSQNTWYNLYWSPDGAVTNSNIIANHCYGITTYKTNENGNTYTPANPLSSPISGAGCGFSSMLKSASLRSYTIANPEQEKRIMQEREEEIMRINEALKANK